MCVGAWGGVGFLEKEQQMRKRRGWMMCWGSNFTQRRRCHSITATDTLNVLGLKLGDGVKSASRPPASCSHPEMSSKSGFILLLCLGRWVLMLEGCCVLIRCLVVVTLCECVISLHGYCHIMQTHPYMLKMLSHENYQLLSVTLSVCVQLMWGILYSHYPRVSYCGCISPSQCYI